MHALCVWQRYPSLSLGKKKIKIEFEDAEGSKYNLSLDGDISKNKILKVYELMESLNAPEGEAYEKNNVGHRKGLGERNMHTGTLTSVGSKVWYIIEHKFPNSTFTSTDIQEMYEEQYKESMRLDAIATYLSRYVNKGKLVRNKKGGKEWVYKVLPQQITIPTDKNKVSSSYTQVNQYLDSKKQANVNHNDMRSLPQTANSFSSLTEVN
jgi:predicted transcriptional regulator